MENKYTKNNNSLTVNCGNWAFCQKENELQAFTSDTIIFLKCKPVLKYDIEHQPYCK